MAGETLGDVIRRLGRLSGLQGDLAQTDAQLLERFARRRDEPAFAALMVRHGPMVLGVCRRLLHNPQEAEDAFQAAFLVLARKAGGVQRQALIGAWLHGVAYRVAARLRGRTARRRGRERPDVDLDALPADAAASMDVQTVVHEEVRRLPDAYRSAVILCYLEGKTNEEAALLLRRPVGTVKSRLTRARELLRVRLTRRGMALSGGALTTGLAVHPAAAPAALLEATVRVAARFAAGDRAGGMGAARAVALTQGVLRAMFLTKMKIAAALVLAVAVLGGVAGLSYRAWAAESGVAPKVVAADKPAPADVPPPANKPKEDADAIQGGWRVTAIETEGKDQDDDQARQVKSAKWVVTADKIVIKTDVPGAGVQSAESTYKLDPTQTPKTIDITPNYGLEDTKGRTRHAIYSLEGDVLKICRSLAAPEIKRLDELVGRRPRPFDLRDLLPDGWRPKELATKEDSRTTLLTLKRMPAEQDKPKDEVDGPGKDKADYAWGKTAGGLQAGLAIAPVEKGSYAVGDTATFVVKVRNVSDGPLEFRVEEGDMHQRASPSVLDADGQRAPLSGPIFRGVGGRAVSKRTLAKDEEIEFATAKLTWGPVAEPRVTEQTIAHVKPGTYKVSYYVYYVNPDDTMNYLTTGPLEVTIKAPEEDPALSRLISSLGEGPIRVRPAAHDVGSVSAEEAVKAAKRAVGVDAPPETVWRVAVSDREFMSGLVDDKPCWLLYYPGAVKLPLSFEGKETRTLDLYVAVDAATGRLWEAFTEPEASWWKRVKQRNEEVVRAYTGRGDEAAADPDPPGVSLLSLLNARAQAIPDLPSGQEYGAQRKAQQVVARHFLYTTPVDTEEKTDKGVRRFRSHDREPVWTIEFDGVDLTPASGPPGPDADLTPDGPKQRKEALPNVERIDGMWDATSGRSLSTGMSP